MKTSFARYYMLAAVFAAIALVIVIQLVRIQTGPIAKPLLEDGRSFEGYKTTIVPVRGQIYDRWGNLLAGNTTVYEVGINLTSVRNPETIALALSVHLGFDYEKMLAIANREPTEDSVYVTVGNYVDPASIARLQELKDQISNGEEISLPVSTGKDARPPSLSGLELNPHLVRTYPENALGSNLLGFVSREGRGYFGVEEKYNNLLAGTTKEVYVSIDPNNVANIPTAPEGASLILTIDREIQKALEEILDRSLTTTGAESGTIIVMQPETGEILGMAGTPRMNLNEFWDYGDVFPGETPFNKAVSQAYEPGSVFKVLTMAAALDSDTVDPDTKYIDTGVFHIGGINIQNWNLGAWGPQTMLGCMQHSLNVCLAWTASEMGAKTFYSYMERFGIGRLTGADIAGEVSGRLKVPGDGDWYEGDLGTNSFGQGVAVTPLQIISAVTAIANDGNLVTPHIVRSVIDNGRQYDLAPQVAGSPISSKTARTLTEMLAVSLEKESSVALVPGYRVSGKTGTAEIPTPAGYTTGLTNASFVGWGPTDDPKFVVYIWLEKPETSQWGSVVAAPVFSEVVSRLVVLMDIPPDDVRASLNNQ